MFHVMVSNQTVFAKKYSDQMNFNEVYTRGGYTTASALGMEGDS